MKKLEHVVSTKQFLDRRLLEGLFSVASEMEERDENHAVPQSLKGKIIACLFYEPSTRTRLSFEAAVVKLGGSVIATENARLSSSAAKGEVLEDTIRVVSGYADAIVLRHHEEGSAEAAAAVSSVPVINAGDGAAEHPTQALLDMYTVQKELGRIEGLCIGLVGDLLYGRTIHSLLPLLALYENIEVYLISPKALALPQTYRDYLKEKEIQFEETENLQGALKKIDVLYVTRIQQERFPNKGEYEAAMRKSYVIDKDSLLKLKQSAIIMHPLPRVGATPEVDKDPRAAYFRQAKNGLYVRMALLTMLFSSKT